MSKMTPGGNYFSDPKDEFELFHNCEMAIAIFVEQLGDEYEVILEDQIQLAKQMTRLMKVYHEGMVKIGKHISIIKPKEDK
jgi:hypothetical protein